MSEIQLSLKVEVTKEINGVEMGVLSDGRSYLTGRGLARLCGVVPSAIISQATNWLNGRRDGRLSQMMLDQGIDGDSLFVEITDNGQTVHAYPEDVCMLVLEYYAFETAKPSDAARHAYRTLSRAGLRAFVYSALGYSPLAVPAGWRQFHDRMTLVSAPIGYFSVFKETADFVIGAIRNGLPVDDHTVPDISVGKAWAAFWTECGLDSKYGERIKHEHNYPDYFPQSASNPQDIWVYPVVALGEFRMWMQRTYIPEKLPKYLDGKVKKGALPASVAQVLALAASAPEPAQLGSPSSATA
ncbi:MAG TPA: hypothetical protein VHO25_24960 [Polyangiaceae bacterium]|nr:hypothetical protein [Polyangiaceae bacterium]